MLKKGKRNFSIRRFSIAEMAVLET